MKAVILAGGRGTRLAEETSIRPKPMVEIGSRPIIWHIMKLYSHYGIKEFIICLGYKGEVIRDYFLNYGAMNSDLTVDIGTGAVELHAKYSEDWKVTLIDTGEETMTGGRLKAVADFLPSRDDFCLTYGDGVADIDISRLIAFHKKHSRQATVTAVSPPNRYGNLNINKQGQVFGFEEKPIMGQPRISAGFFVLSPQVLDRIEDETTVWEHGPLCALTQDGELAAFEHHGFWMGMDSLRDKQILEHLWSTGKAPWAVWKRDSE